jgi:glyoxylase-like metal-dependent hydrolase (beta-lactamase superfamily II)
MGGALDSEAEVLKLETFPVGPISANCVLVWDPEKGTGVVVDPGEEAGRIRKRIETLGFKVTAVLQTHAHFDHLGAAKALQDLWKCPVYLHPGDLYLVETLDMQTGLFGMQPVPAPSVTELIPGAVQHELRVLHTPGHTPGSCCFHGTSDQGPFVLAGDTLFQGGVGRTDLWGGHWDQLQASIQRELYSLEDRTLVIPGHGSMTTIGEEAVHNPFVKR